MFRKLLELKFLLIFLSSLFLAENAHAWGPAVHLVNGSKILAILPFLPQSLAALIKENPLDYLYGTIAADIYIGKGSSRQDDHCHNWDVGFSLLENAKNKTQEAFVWGYLSHLAADIIAHNYFVPKYMLGKRITKKFNHIYWEVMAETLVSKSAFRHGQDLIAHGNKENDALLNATIDMHGGFFRIKKYIFKKSINLNNYRLWGNRVERFSAKIDSAEKAEVLEFIDLSYYLVLDLLMQQKNSIIMKYDPIGVDCINCKNRVACKIPEEILNLKVKYQDLLAGNKRV